MTSKTHIVLVESGWVLVGETAVSKNLVKITKAHIIRRWGTTKGLGEIALNGPTSKTILDKLGVALVERSHVHFSIPCDDTKWNL
jgi:hypothetical protein